MLESHYYYGLIINLSQTSAYQQNNLKNSCWIFFFRTAYCTGEISFFFPLMRINTAISFGDHHHDVWERVYEVNMIHTDRVIFLTVTLKVFPLKKKYINFGAWRILRPLSCTELNSIQGNVCGLGVSIIYIEALLGVLNIGFFSKKKITFFFEKSASTIKKKTYINFGFWKTFYVQLLYNRISYKMGI